MENKWYNIILSYIRYYLKERKRKMEHLFTAWNLKGREIKNRVCVPPMVCFGWSDDRGMVTERNIAHYRAIAKGGAGLIIQEATCINRQGRLSLDQLGIWEEEQISGLKKITEAVHEEKVPILVQLHHAGVISVTEDRVCPSDYTFQSGVSRTPAQKTGAAGDPDGVHKGTEKRGRALSVEEIHRMEEDFIQAARRAYQAGYDGVELHGCHSYLLSQFMNRLVNKRNDEYGPEGMEILRRILEGIRKATPPEFIVGIRLGAFEPELSDGIRHARWLEAHGIDFINVSYGFDMEARREKPDGYPFAEAVYGAKKIKEAVSVPVFAVYGIQDGETAEAVLQDTNVDMVNIGRGVLVNYQWANDVKEGRDPGKCLYCSTCMWRVDADRCAGRLKRQREGR